MLDMLCRAVLSLAWIGSMVCFAIARQWVPAGLTAAAYFATRPPLDAEVRSRLYYYLKPFGGPLLFGTAFILGLLARSWVATGLLILTGLLFTVLTLAVASLSKADSWIAARLRGHRLSTEVGISLDANGDAYVFWSRRPTEEQKVADLCGLCALYGPKMILNAQESSDTTLLLTHTAALLRDRESTGLDNAEKLASYCLGPRRLLDSPPEAAVRKDIVAQLWRSRHGVPIIQTHFGLDVGPREYIASVLLLWAWAAREIGEQAIWQFHLAVGLVPYYQREHSSAHGQLWEFRGWLACSAYIVNMLASQQALYTYLDGSQGPGSSLDRIAELVDEAKRERSQGG